MIVEVIESDDHPLRMPVGGYAQEAVEMRRELDEWEQLVDEHRCFSW